MAAVSKNENMCINVYWKKEQSKITAKYVYLKPFVTLFQHPVGLENLTGHIWSPSRSLPTPSLRNTFLAKWVFFICSTSSDHCKIKWRRRHVASIQFLSSINRVDLAWTSVTPRQEKPVYGCWLKDG